MANTCAHEGHVLCKLHSVCAVVHTIIICNNQQILCMHTYSLIMDHCWGAHFNKVTACGIYCTLNRATLMPAQANAV